MGGEFQYVDHVKANSIALWNGTSWIDQGINEKLIVNAIAELDGVIYALAYDPFDDIYDYGSSFPIYYLDNNDGRWELMANAPVINIPYGQSISFSMSNTKTLFAHSSSHSLFIGGDFYVLLNNGQTAQGCSFFISFFIIIFLSHLLILFLFFIYGKSDELFIRDETMVLFWCRI